MNSKNDNSHSYNRRREDRGFVGSVARIYDRYKSVWIFAGIIGLALGFGFQTPADVFKKIEARLETAEKRIKGLEDTEHKLLELACMGSNISQHDKEILELPCTSYAKDSLR